MAVATMAQEARISTRINAHLKKEGEAVFAKLGVKPSQAIALFYAQAVIQQGMPFELRIPNDETLSALREVSDPEFRKNAPRYANAAELFAALRS
jgi:DNA-damage-inducible protein J